jgi:Fe2+ or Zn2+ uptake regulation protein
LEQYLEKLKNFGLKLTPRRQAIIELFLNCKSHMTPEEVLHKLKIKIKRCGVPGIYRNLESLVECGILARIHKFDRKRHYGLCSAMHNEHHHHITCVKCGRVDKIKDCALKDIKKINGYKVVSHFFQINGICPECSQRKK